MGFLLEEIADILFNKLVDHGEKKLNECLEESKMKKILKKCFIDYIELEKIQHPDREPNCFVDDDAIDRLNKDNLMPNLTVNELANNLKSVFDICIKTDDEDKKETIKRYICANYKVNVVDLITIGQVDEDVHKTQEMITESNREIKNKLSELNEMQKKTYDAVKNDSLFLSPISFVNELKDSKVYCYVSLCITDDYRVADDFFENVADEIDADVEKYTDKSGFDHVDFNFEFPKSQKDFKTALSIINKMFSAEGIYILSASTHN